MQMLFGWVNFWIVIWVDMHLLKSPLKSGSNRIQFLFVFCPCWQPHKAKLFSLSRREIKQNCFHSAVFVRWQIRRALTFNRKRKTFFRTKRKKIFFQINLLTRTNERKKHSILWNKNVVVCSANCDQRDYLGNNFLKLSRVCVKT